VDLACTNAAFPYSSWSTAATTIQDAVDAAVAGDLILVNNGIYKTGGRSVNGFSLSNRVAVTKALTLQSLNGPNTTVIQGYQVPGVTNADDAVRCVYLTNNAVLAGFTLSLGATRLTNGDYSAEQVGGGAWCEDTSAVISNCVITGNSAGDAGGGVYRGTLNHCAISSNTVATTGGGAYASYLNDCTVAGNFAGWGGGGVAAYYWDTHSAILNRCVLVGNATANFAGGAFGGVLNHCTLSGNFVIKSTGDGSSGGIDSGELDACVISGNRADYGGGAQSCNLFNCLVTNNSATAFGGGLRSCTAVNCTVVNNAAGWAGGGADSSELDNSIVFFSTASSNANYTLDTCAFNYTCTTPLPASGVANLGSDPLFAGLAGGNLRLESNSPCINAGNNAYVTNNSASIPDMADLDDRPRILGLTVDAGAFEFPTPVAMVANYTNVAVGFPVAFTSQVYAGDHTTFWIDFGDGTVFSNTLSLTHGWTLPGDYAVRLTAFSDTFPSGVSTVVVVHVVQGFYYAALGATNPLPPYVSWNTAATNIQDAVDQAVAGGTVWVSNGVYSLGGRVVYGSLTNRLVVNLPVLVRSANGPATATILGVQVPGTTNGDAAVRCVYLTNDAALAGFTLSQGATRTNGDAQTEQCGGAVFCDGGGCAVSNCVLYGNAAANGGGAGFGGNFLNCTFSTNASGGSGGGVNSAVLTGCTLSGNFAAGNGGGADTCTGTNCLFTGNTSYNANIWIGGAGGGANHCTLYQCAITGNAGYGGGGVRSSTLDVCRVSSNSVSGSRCGGGGIENCVARNCTIIGNQSAEVGGGVDYSILTNCIIIGNHAGTDGGGFWGGWSPNILSSCLVLGNVAEAEGGGINDANVYRCTVVGNWAAHGGGAVNCSFFNCIVYHNDAGYAPNHVYGYFENSCTTPMPVYGTRNFTADPQLADTFHLSAGSPCRAQGNPIYAVGVDLDGESWANQPSVGCDEYTAGLTGPLAVGIQADYANVAAGFTVNLLAQTTGRAASSRWDFGDGTSATNLPFASHSWAAPGDYTVTLRVFNNSYPAGVSTAVTVHVVAPPLHYVSLSSASPVPPYSSWNTAATNIQDAVDASSVPGAQVLVADGIYQTGGRVMFGILTNRVAVTKPVRLQSVNGAAVTVIQGSPLVGTSGIRALWLTSGSALSGFTITGGGTRDWSGDEPREISGGGVWCQSSSVLVSDCMFISNSASWDGGGITGGTLSNCTFIGNSAGDSGGGAAGALISNCLFTNNTGVGGGGVWSSAVNHCSFLNNNGGGYGGGADESVLRNSVFTGNNGSGARDSVLYNCSVVGNAGFGVHGQSQLYNCIVLYNTAGNGTVNNYSSDSSLAYCCTVPLAPGSGNTAADPLMTDVFHLGANSPCRGAGNPAYAQGLDIDGQPWLNPPSIGADEYYPGATGSLGVAVQSVYSNLATNFAGTLLGQILGHAAWDRWDFGDGTFATNGLTAAHAWKTPGDYTVTLTAYNDDYPTGISASVLVHVLRGLQYVAASNPTPVAPFDSWPTAATNIQDAIDVAPAGGSVLVADGLYQFGAKPAGGASNRVATLVPLTIQSVNGPASTVIDGTGSVRGVYLTNGASLYGFTVTGGNGGGVIGQSLESVISNCVVTANLGSGANNCSAYRCLLSANSASSGGGASGCLLQNCLLTGNVATGDYSGGGGAAGGTLNYCIISNNAATGAQGGGGGASGCVLNSCLVISNSARYSGGVDASTINNCTLVGNSVGGQPWSWGGGEGNSTVNNSIVYYNSGSAPNIGYSSTASHCCAPDAAPGPGNFTNAPLFRNLAAGDLRLQSNSPCINAGSKAFVATAADLDGNPRIVGGAVDIGAYEYQTPASIISYAWLQQYGLATDGSADFADTDHTGMNNWQKWIAGLNPTNPASVLAMLAPGFDPISGGLVVRWQSVDTRSYYVQRGTDLAVHPPFLTIQSNILGQPITTTWTDSSATNCGSYFYRVGVQDGP
jgi:PKD repeat protein